MNAPDLNATPPDFVGVGAQRSGTTWWFRMLLAHPQIKLSSRRKKELHFFNKFCTRRMLDEDVARYHGLFPRVPGKISGEWTPRYMHDPWTPRLLHRVAPDARILVLLRDPVERYRSGIMHQVKVTPDRAAAAVAVDAFNRGRYASQISRLLSFYERDQVLILQYERCRDHFAEQYARTLRFLGVADDFEPDPERVTRGRDNGPQKEPLWPELEDELQAGLEPDVRELSALVPELDLGLWPHFAHLVDAGAASGRVR